MNQFLGVVMASIDDVISAFDSSEKLYQEREVAKQIRSFLSDNKIDKPNDEQYSDLIAFEFAENCQDKEDGWGTYFGPFSILTNGEGGSNEYPSLSQVTPEMIEHWGNRAKSLNHPILITRYANLVWDFSKKVSGTNPDIDFARLTIDSSIRVPTIIYGGKDGILFNYSIPNKLNRALSIAISINDSIRIKSAVDAMIAYEDRIGEDEHPATWGFCFDNLLSNKRAGLTDELKVKIVNDLESRLERISSLGETGNGNRWCIEHAAMRLAQFYRKIGKLDDAKRVIIKYGEVLNSLAENSAPLIASTHLETLRNLYQQFGLNDMAKQIDIRLQVLGPKVVAEFKKVPFRYELKQEDIDAYLAEILDGDLDTVLCNISLRFIPNKERAVNSLQSIASKCPLTHSIPNQIYDHDGRLVASIDSIDTDLNGRLISHISQRLQFEMIFLNLALSGVIKKFDLTTDKILDIIFQSAIFEAHKRELFKAGIDAYLNDNHMVAAHLLIPQIEAGLRNLLRLADGLIYTPNKSGGFNYRTLGDLLNDGLLKEIFRQIFGDDCISYFKILFTEKLGWNIRNDICHGIIRAESLQKPITDRILHVLILLSLIKLKPQSDTVDVGKNN